MKSFQATRITFLRCKLRIFNSVVRANVTISLHISLDFSSVSSTKARTSRYRFFACFFLSPGFHKLGHSVMRMLLISNVRNQRAILVLGPSGHF